MSRQSDSPGPFKLAIECLCQGPDRASSIPMYAHRGAPIEDASKLTLVVPPRSRSC